MDEEEPGTHPWMKESPELTSELRKSLELIPR
jgi:hypothetical protein